MTRRMSAPRRDELLEWIRKNPNVTVDDCQVFLGVSRTSAFGKITRLMQKGLLVEDKSARPYCYRVKWEK